MFDLLTFQPLTFSGIKEMQEQVRQQSAKNKWEKDIYRIKKGTYDLLPYAFVIVLI